MCERARQGPRVGRDAGHSTSHSVLRSSARFPQLVRPVYNVGMIKQIYKVLQSVCHSCGKLLVHKVRWVPISAATGAAPSRGCRPGRARDAPGV